MIWLIFAHFLGDFALQKEWLALNKRKWWYVMMAHGIIWTGCICVALEYAGCLEMWKVYFLYFGHIACDQWKGDNKKDFPTWRFYVDQVWHILQCFIVGTY